LSLVYSKTSFSLKTLFKSNSIACTFYRYKSKNYPSTRIADLRLDLSDRLVTNELRQPSAIKNMTWRLNRTPDEVNSGCNINRSLIRYGQGAVYFLFAILPQQISLQEVRLEQSA